MSNPYAPPEDRREDAPTPGERPGPAGPPPPPGLPVPTAGGTPDRSPEGVPYEHRRGTTARGGPAPHPTDARRVAVLTRTTALLVLLSLVAGLLPFPYHLSAVPVILGAIGVGLTALVRATRSHVRGTPRAVLGLLIAVAALGLARPALTALTWQAESEYARCQEGALTVQAKQQCQTAYEEALDERSGQFTRQAP